MKRVTKKKKVYWAIASKSTNWLAFNKGRNQMCIYKEREIAQESLRFGAGSNTYGGIKRVIIPVHITPIKPSKRKV